MENILLCIADDGSNDDQWLHLASNIVEALTYSMEEIPTVIPTIHLIASVEACLEIGLGAIGRSETRTLEGGDRRLSSVVLIPCRGAERQWDFEEAMLGRNGDEFKENGALDDLAAFGTIEVDDMQGWEGYRNRRMEDAVESIIKRRTVENIILVGENRKVEYLSKMLSDISNARIIHASIPPSDGDIEELVNQLQWLHSTDSFDSEIDQKRADMESVVDEKIELKMKREAVKEAMQLASILTKFDRGQSSRRDDGGKIID